MLSVLDLLFPRQNKDFSSISNYLTAEEISLMKAKYKPLSKKLRKYLTGIFVASKYSDDLTLDLLNRVKFEQEHSIASSFGDLIYQKVFIDCDVFVPDPDAVIPVPPDPKRYLERGFSLPFLISSNLSKKLPQTLFLNILKKKYPTVQQSSLEKKQRIKNLTNTFELSSKPNLANKEILWIIDDVSTTGTTLYQCAKVIKKEYPFLKIYGVVVAGN